jgi:RNA polymerase sigma factor (sigma-70 family)
MDGNDWLEHEAAAGDAAAFGVLVRRHQSRLRGFLLRMTRGDRALADDLAQETFLEAWRKLAQWRGGAFFGWLSAIAYSRYLMAARKRKLERLGETDDQADEIADDAPNAEVASAVRLDLERAMARLRPEERAALTLCFALGLSHEEAAVALAMPLGTLKSHVNRGREKLAALLGDWRIKAVP